MGLKSFQYPAACKEPRKQTKRTERGGNAAQIGVAIPEIRERKRPPDGCWLPGWVARVGRRDREWLRIAR
ncbi:hypothetical protein NECAME_18610 [Necator americanus]|uniref:Uncharacterized protein n=1 Tax=Necator americanus TaxID=51031 RepID=W2STU9_NECAM|nr:hypothetical protein NECAME_18610 [Necator americanus]ETN72928.1 hypothetical protein NECAME_18610 [Necator americanus]